MGGGLARPSAGERTRPHAGNIAGATASLLAVGLAAALAWPSAAASQVADPPPPVRLNPGDVVRLVVENDPELGGEYPVGTDGVVIFPLAGPLEVAGRDFADVEREVRAELARELAPGMTVQLVPVFHVAVVGEVRLPGLHPMDPTRRLVDALTMAGSFTPLADRGRIELVREGRTILEAEEETLVGGGPLLRPGDRIVVGRVGWFRENLGVVIGAVGSLTVAVVTGLVVR